MTADLVVFASPFDLPRTLHTRGLLRVVFRVHGLQDYGHAVGSPSAVVHELGVPVAFASPFHGVPDVQVP